MLCFYLFTVRCSRNTRIAKTIKHCTFHWNVLAFIFCWCTQSAKVSSRFVIPHRNKDTPSNNYKTCCCNHAAGVALMRVISSGWTLLLLAATVRSFARMPLGLSDRNNMVLWPGCEGRARFSFHTKNVRLVRFVVKRRGCYCNHSVGVVLKCAVHHERNVCKEQHHIYVARTSNNRVIAACELSCCLLPQCEALRTCRSGFPIATVSTDAAGNLMLRSAKDAAVLGWIVRNSIDYLFLQGFYRPFVNWWHHLNYIHKL